MPLSSASYNRNNIATAGGVAAYGVVVGATGVSSGHPYYARTALSWASNLSMLPRRVLAGVVVSEQAA
jgi:hypothetical protein